jgi:O-succinylbenzoic acid--CoA ligase
MKNEILNCLSQRSETPALRDRDWLIGYDTQQLHHFTKELLINLNQLTLSEKRSPRILIAETNPLQFLASFLAAVAAETNVFLGNPHWGIQEWKQVFDLVQPDLVWGKEEINSKVEGLSPEFISGVYKPRKIQNSKLRVFHSPSPIPHPLIMIPTGGSSGKIRFAMHTWSTLSASVAGFCNYFNCKQINSCCVLPLYHVSGLMQFLRSFLTDGKLAIFPYQALKRGEKPEIEPQEFFLSLVPTQLQFLLQSDPNWLSRFHTVLLGGAPAWRSLLDTARKHRIRLAPTYGMTETASQVATLKPEDFLQGNDSSGQILPHAKISIQNETGELLDTQETGKITIEADSLYLGYYPHLVSEKKSTFFTTDDLGFLDPQGYLHIVGRNSQKIITGGENVFPAEVEAAILATNLVADVVAIAVPDFQWGQVVTAVYVPKNLEVSTNLIREKIKHQLSKYKQPKHWIRVNNLPRNERGKINYQQITELARNHLDKNIE